jgi:hypothetical protein
MERSRSASPLPLSDLVGEPGLGEPVNSMSMPFPITTKHRRDHNA